MQVLSSLANTAVNRLATTLQVQTMYFLPIKQTYPLSYPHYPQWKNKGKEWKNIVNIKHLFCAIFLNNTLPECRIVGIIIVI